MLIPILVSSAVVLALTALCWFKPNAGRITLGFFFLAMALGVNGSFTLGNPQAYLDYAGEALIPFYRNLAVAVISLSPRLFGLLLIAFQITLALLALHRGKAVRVGIIGMMLFVAGIAPLSWVQLPWLGLLAAGAFVLRREYPRSLVDILRSGSVPSAAAKRSIK